MLVGDAYPDIYVHRLDRMLERRLSRPYRLHCIIDRPRRLPASVSVIDAREWSDVRREGMRITTTKIRLFDPQSVPFEEFLYLDLSVVIQRDLDCLLQYCDAKSEELVIVRDWHYDVFNTCVMRIRHCSELQSIYQAFVGGKTYPHRWHGDQDFVHACLLDYGHQDHVAFFDPDHVVSYRNLRFVNRNNETAAYEAMQRATIVKFHGRLKMHQILNPYHNFAGIRLKNFRHGSRDANFWTRELKAIWR
jgi:hypothetical protein